MWKIGPKFSHLLTVRAEGADPPPPSPYGQPDRKKTVFFLDDFPLDGNGNILSEDIGVRLWDEKFNLACLVLPVAILVGGGSIRHWTIMVGYTAYNV